MPHVIAWSGFLNAWPYVAIGAMVVFCLSITVGRTRRRHHRPGVEG